MHILEFFAGGGMARVGFGRGTVCLLANDIDPIKCKAYRRNFGGGDLHKKDIRLLSPSDLPGQADVAWASSPCQDVSAAGRGVGLSGTRSGLVFAFISLMAGLAAQGRAPRVIVIENVERLIASRRGHDLAAVVEQLSNAGYRAGALVVDAEQFLPQSRRRVFILAVRHDVQIPFHLMATTPQQNWHPTGLERVLSLLSIPAQERWIWWTLPAPPHRTSVLADIVDAVPKGVTWDSRSRTKQLLSMMSPLNSEKVEAARASGELVVGAMSQRTRVVNGERIQRIEVRFDGAAGCLLSPKGGSSCQRLLFVEGRSVRSRLLSPREAARLMGLPDRYKLPARFWDAMRLIGDGVAVPVVQHLVCHLIVPVLSASTQPIKMAA